MTLIYNYKTEDILVMVKLFGKKEGPTEDYMEINLSDASSQGLGKIGVRIEKLNDFADTDKILKDVRDGSVIFLKIKTLKEKDIGELKRAVDKLKKTVLAQNGDIVGVEQDWLLISPEFAVVHR